MKRTLLFALALLIIFAAVAIAQEQDEYPSLGADIYFQALFVNQHNFRPSSGMFGDSMGLATGNFTNDIDNDFDQVLESRFRFFLKAEITPQIRGRFTLEVNPEYGHERGFGDFRINNGSSGTGELRIKHFYIEADHLNGNLGYRVGRQGFGTPQSLIVGDPDAEGITLWGKSDIAGKVTLQAAVVDTNETREIEDIYSHIRYDAPTINKISTITVYGSSLVIRDLNGGANNQAPEIDNGGGSSIGRFIMGPSNVDMPSGSRADLYWAGLQLTNRVGNFFAEFDAVASLGTVDVGESFHLEDTDGDGDDEVVYDNKPWNNIKEVRGYTGMLELAYSRAWYRIGAAGAFASGHVPDPESDVYTGYVDINADFTFTRFFFDGGPYLVTTGFASPTVQGSGLTAAKLYFMTNPTYWLEANLQVAGLSAVTDRPQLDDGVNEYADAAKNAGKYYGSEVDLWLVFKPINHINWLLEFDYFQPGDYFAGTGTDVDDPGNGFMESLDPAWKIGAGFIFQ